MLTAVYIPSESNLHAALRTRGARQAIAAGMKLYTDGTHTMLMPRPMPGWYPLAVTVRDPQPTDDDPTEEAAA